MIEADEIFSDSDKRIALWCNGAEDTSDLAVLADNIAENKINLVSVPENNLRFMWTYLENSGVKILTRYVFETLHRDIDNDVSVMSEKIISMQRQGAHGVQIFIKMRDFEQVIDLLATIRDDLFFEHDLCIFLNIQEVNANEWAMVFAKLREIRANSFGLLFNEDMGNRSDFIGRIYGMLDNWDFDGDLQFVMGNNFDRIDQVIRLVESGRPELADKLHFFLEY